MKLLQRSKVFATENNYRSRRDEMLVETKTKNHIESQDKLPVAYTHAGSFIPRMNALGQVVWRDAM